VPALPGMQPLPSISVRSPRSGSIRRGGGAGLRLVYVDERVRPHGCALTSWRPAVDAHTGHQVPLRERCARVAYHCSLSLDTTRLDVISKHR